jgi:2-polyprenyl-3-methyl-5-hydroxy-6-metoxy-1,4-benzoquinol methylase
MYFKVHFEIGDVTQRNYKPNSFDVIYSKEVFLHVPDQKNLIKSCYVSFTHVIMADNENLTYVFIAVHFCCCRLG